MDITNLVAIGGGILGVLSLLISLAMAKWNRDTAKAADESNVLAREAKDDARRVGDAQIEAHRLARSAEITEIKYSHYFISQIPDEDAFRRSLTNDELAWLDEGHFVGVIEVQFANVGQYPAYGVVSSEVSLTSTGPSRELIAESLAPGAIVTAKFRTFEEMYEYPAHDYEWSYNLVVTYRDGNGDQKREIALGLPHPVDLQREPFTWSPSHSRLWRPADFPSEQSIPTAGNGAKPPSP